MARKGYGSAKAEHRKAAGNDLYQFRQATKRIDRALRSDAPRAMLCAGALEDFRIAASHAGQYRVQRRASRAVAAWATGVQKKLDAIQTRIYRKCMR